MYTAYFGLKEKPFSIAPDPQYLFMSDRHREALAHLTYGLGDAGGFVLLTGEVGTGKTTVSRCLMERLPENTQAAFILNPTLSSQELLATICDELKIRYRKTGATLKTLTDKIQDKLLKNHKEGINTLLIIDEAQHLQPEVLEQLRLLTNLETNTKKLLQVILIGQPELQVLLKRRDLRQLAQRITARYHLLPLNKQEVAQYIKHRLSIAEGIRALFSVQAMNTIHKICGGIPRLINLVCERALQNAYSSNVATVNKTIVLLSAQEALGDDYEVTYWWQSKVFKFIALSIAFISISVGAYFIGSQQVNIKISNALSESTDPVSIEFEKTEIVEQSVTTTPAVDGLTIQEPITQKDVVLNKKPLVTIVDNPKSSLTVATVKTDNVVNKVNEKPLPKIDTIVPKEVAPEEAALPKKVEENKNIEVKPVEGVSEELLALFKKAVISNDINNEAPDDSKSNASDNIESINNMPLWVQDGIPQLTFEMHIYASDGQGWVKVNGRDRYEGDSIARELTLVRILPQKVVLNFRGEKFTMQALSSW